MAIDKHRERLRRGKLWDGLTFSMSRIWSEVLHPVSSDSSRIIAEVLLQKTHADIFGSGVILRDRDRELITLLNAIRVAYQSAFKYQTISVKRPASKLALRNKWSLENGLYGPNTGTSPTDIAGAVSRHNEAIKYYNSQLASLLRGMKRAKDHFIPDTILQPLTDDELLGSNDQWRKYVSFKPLSGAEIRRALRTAIGGYYDEKHRTGGFSFIKRKDNVLLKLFIETHSLMGQFTYTYHLESVDNEQDCFSITFESLLGLPSNGWDGIEIQDQECFRRDFSYIDNWIREALE